MHSTGGNLSQYKSDEEHVTRELISSRGEHTIILPNGHRIKLSFKHVLYFVTHTFVQLSVFIREAFSVCWTVVKTQMHSWSKG